MTDEADIKPDAVEARVALSNAIVKAITEAEEWTGGPMAYDSNRFLRALKAAGYEVRAANSHAELVSALKEAERLLSNSACYEDDLPEIRAAIAKATA